MGGWIGVSPHVRDRLDLVVVGQLELCHLDGPRVNPKGLARGLARRPAPGGRVHRRCVEPGHQHDPRSHHRPYFSVPVTSAEKDPSVHATGSPLIRASIGPGRAGPVRPRASQRPLIPGTKKGPAGVNQRGLRSRRFEVVGC